MRLAGIAIVRNECDIVEAFVRHNATALDRLYVIDNDSSDATPEILRRLAASGLPLKLGHDPMFVIPPKRMLWRYGVRLLVELSSVTQM